MQTKYTFHEDPGHGWLQVTMDELRRLKLVRRISSYSYISGCGTIAFLEEDCDFTLFDRAKKAVGEDYTYVVSPRDGGWVRNRDHFPTTITASLTIV